MTDASNSGETKVLGLTRWVQVVFLVLFLFAFWILDKVITLGWARFSEPNSTLASATAALVAGFGAWRFYKAPRIQTWADEVVGELTRVAWPSRRETGASTIVVIVASLVAAAILGAFDAAWSTITDLIYKV